jgi:putative transposase
MHDPRKGFPALRRGRHSQPGASYFITICAERPCAGLIAPETESIVRRHYLEIADWSVHCAVTMPDHLHLLVTLSASGELAKCVRACKGRLSPHLRRIGIRWQPSFYDHRLRNEEDWLPVFLYIFLNPYRARLIPPSESWPGYYCSREDWAWFAPLTAEKRPEPAWLRD